MMGRTATLLFLWLLLILTDQAATLADDGQEEECVMRDDGTCMTSNDDCQNIHEDCDQWALSGECHDNPSYMLYGCVKACELCGKTRYEVTAILEERKEVIEQEKRRKEEERKHVGLRQLIHSEKGPKALDAMMDYMANVVMVEDRFSEELRGFCLNQHENCVEWASIGECDANRNYMATHCAPACHACHLLIYDERCPWTPSNETNIWKAGDLDNMFERIATNPDFTAKYQVEVLSRPPDGPWVVTLDNFLTDDEADRLIELGGHRGYDKSMDVGSRRPDGTYSDNESSNRTSTNTWCLADCYDDDFTKAVLTKMEEVTGIPDAYAEYLQLLNYEVGQFYGQHHDYIDHLLHRAEGVRVATLFLYLNNVEGGGGTNFPLLNNLTVMPKKGKALLWPSVLNDDPNAKDGRTDHQALPVEAGVKYGANAWLHNRAFKEAYARGCA